MANVATIVSGTEIQRKHADGFGIKQGVRPVVNACAVRVIKQGLVVTVGGFPLCDGCGGDMFIA